MKPRLILIVLLSTLLLTACGAPSAPPTVPTTPPTMLPTQPPSVLPTMAPSVLPTQPPSPLPGGGLVTRPEADVWKDAPAAALNSRADLAQQLHVDPDTIALISVEHVDWPDACMGIQAPGVMCAMVITPGYRVILEADGKQYEYHTNETGDVVRLATPMP